jgi:hypothetical protein
MRPASSSTSSSRHAIGRLRPIVIVIFSCLCATNYLVGLFPKSSDAGAAIIEATGPIRWTTGTWQRWQMFHSIPSLHKISVHIDGRDAAGVEKTFGPRLPGLTAFSPIEKNRQNYVFMRMSFDPPGPYGDDYLRLVGEALFAADPELTEFWIRYEMDYTRDLRHIRRDGVLTKHITKEFGPYPLPSARR